MRAPSWLGGLLGRKEPKGAAAPAQPDAPVATGVDPLQRKVWTELHNLEKAVQRVEGEIEPYSIPEFAYPPLPAAAALSQAAEAAPGTVRALVGAGMAEAAAKRRAAAEAGLRSLAADAAALETQAAGLVNQVDAVSVRAEGLRRRVGMARAGVRGCLGLPLDARPGLAFAGAGLQGSAAGLAAATQALDEELELLAGDLGSLEAALAEAAEEMRRQLDVLGEVAHAITIRGARPRCEALQQMVGAMDTAWAALPPEAQADEAVRHYRSVLGERLGEFRRRLEQVERELSGGEVSLGTVDIRARIEALEARCARLRTSWYGEDQAAPMVQQYLRPLLDDLIRDFLEPLMEEAYGTDEGHPLRAAAGETRRVLKETIDFEVIFPQPGERVDERLHEEREVLVAASDAERDTVAETARPGYRWAGEVLAKARVISRR